MSSTIEGLYNFRDTGGLPLAAGGATRPGVLYRSDALSAVTDAGLTALAQTSIGVVVDFRTPAERTTAPDRLPPSRPFRTVDLSILEGAMADMAAEFLGPDASRDPDAIAVVPAVYLVGHLRAAPSTAIMLTCAYWLLVPGAMGFIGLSEAAAGTSGATGTILQTFGSLIAIAIGMVIGAGLSRDVTAVRRAWRAPQTGDDATIPAQTEKRNP